MPKATRVVPEETVSLREAKANLSSLTRQAKAGARIVITNHGTPMADLVPHGASAAPVTCFKRPGPLPKPIQLIGKGPSASQQMLLDREG